MSTFRVTVERLTIHPHPNADRLELAQVGKALLRAVVLKGAYRTGDLAVYIPEQAILPDDLIAEFGLENLLAGKTRNRVKAIRLRGELSQGVVCRPAALADLDWRAAHRDGTDLADKLGITKWTPEIPAHMSGDVVPAPDLIRWIDIENLQRYPDIFTPGERVIATEKLHGCLHGRTRILMPDGSHRLISHLVQENYRGNVLGINKHGQVIETPVLATFDNGKTTGWLRVEVSRRGIGRGAASGAVTMTPNHRVYSPGHAAADEEGFVLAGNLTVDDEVWLHRTEITLPPLAEQVLIGKMLGDGSLQDGGVAWGHAAKQRAYVAWTAAMLGPDLCSGIIDERFTSGFGTPMARCSTRSSIHIRDLFADWITPVGKQVPASAIDKIGPIALAFWYMDDGNLAHHEGQEDRALFATNGFDEQSLDNLIKALDRFGIEAVKAYSSGWRLRLNCEAAERLFLLVAPYVPESMQYKLPERYRGGVAGFPRTFGTFKPTVRPQKVTAVIATANGYGPQRPTDNPRGSTKYDMQTAAGNYFANGMLVHNSAFMATMDVSSARPRLRRVLRWIPGLRRLADHPSVRGRMWVSSKGHGSQNLALVDSPTNLYWRAARRHDLAERLADMARENGATRVAVFGEVYGAGVQDLHYGVNSGRDETLGFAAFDLVIEDGPAGPGRRWVDAADAPHVCRRYGIPFVPVLYDGLFDLDALTAAASGPTVAGGGAHIREGIVIRPATGRRSDVLGGRAIAKLVSPAYLTRKGNVTEYE